MLLLESSTLICSPIAIELVIGVNRFASKIPISNLRSKASLRSSPETSSLISASSELSMSTALFESISIWLKIMLLQLRLWDNRKFWLTEKFSNGCRHIEISGRKLNFLTQYIFCRSRRDESIDNIKSEFYYLEHFLKKF